MMDAMHSDTKGCDYEIILDNDSKVPLLEQEEMIKSLRNRHRVARLRWLLAFIMTAIFGLISIAYIFYPHSSFHYNSSWKLITPKNVSLPHIYNGVQTQNDVNSTLGFERVFALNLPRRIDKKDELTLMGYGSDIKVDFLSNRLTKEIADVGLPFHINFPKPGVVGCWRAHADAWQKIVSERITTALIVEDDVDWDADIKKQLQRMHQPFATLLTSENKDGSPRVSTSADPWMHEDWDILFLGYCLEAPFTKENHPPDIDYEHPPHVLYNDDTLPDREHTGTSMAAYLEHYGHDVGGPNVTSPKRLIKRLNSPVCTSAYAVSLRGASRLLYHLTRELTAPVDNNIAWAITDGKLKGYAPLPPIMGQWKILDGGRKNSDIEVPKGEKRTELNHNPSIGFSLNIRKSVRKALREILTHPRAKLASPAREL